MSIRPDLEAAGIRAQAFDDNDGRRTRDLLDVWLGDSEQDDPFYIKTYRDEDTSVRELSREQVTLLTRAAADLKFAHRYIKYLEKRFNIVSCPGEGCDDVMLSGFGPTCYECFVREREKENAGADGPENAEAGS